MTNPARAHRGPRRGRRLQQSVRAARRPRGRIAPDLTPEDERRPALSLPSMYCDGDAASPRKRWPNMLQKEEGPSRSLRVAIATAIAIAAPHAHVLVPAKSEGPCPSVSAGGEYLLPEYRRGALSTASPCVSLTIDRKSFQEAAKVCLLKPSNLPQAEFTGKIGSLVGRETCSWSRVQFWGLAFVPSGRDSPPRSVDECESRRMER